MSGGPPFWLVAFVFAFVTFIVGAHIREWYREWNEDRKDRKRRRDWLAAQARDLNIHVESKDTMDDIADKILRARRNHPRGIAQ